MNYLKIHQTLFSAAFYILFMLNATNIVAQEDLYLKVARFSILIETSGDKINLTCNEGCAWKQLSFGSSIKSEPQAVDQYGMTTWPGKKIKKDSSLSNFLFTIKRTQDGVSLEGKEGILWPSLTFDCADGKCLRKIDGWGTTDLKKK